MSPRQIVLAALAAAVTLTSVASAGVAATKQRVSITSKGMGSPAGQFVFTPLEAGPGRSALKRDSGTETSVHTRRVAIREGLRVEIENAVITSRGKLGSFVIRHRVEWVGVAKGYTVGTGTWKFVRGTGQYARIRGHGRSGWILVDTGRWHGRMGGLLTLP